MTEIQQTNIAVANFIIGKLHKDKPFNLVLNAGETGALFHIASGGFDKAFYGVFGRSDDAVNAVRGGK